MAVGLAVGRARTLWRTLALGIGLALALGCPAATPDDAGSPGADAGDGADDAGQGPTLLSLTLSPAAPELPVGASVRMSALGSYSDGSSAQLASEVAWSSDAPAIADVGSEGAEAARVTAYAPGTATIRATLAGVEGSVVVTVLERAAVSLSITPESVSLAEGERAQLMASAVFDDDTSGVVSERVAWLSSAPAVASVDERGLVIASGEGDAQITASLDGVSASIAVHVGPPVVVQVSAFNKHTAALLSNGRVLAFGHNRYGQTGVAPGTTPELCVDDDGCAGTEVCDVNAGGRGVCSRSCLAATDCDAGDECDCLERDGQGACTRGFCVDVVATPTLVPGFTDVRRVVTTGFATFAILEDGSVLGVGRNTGGMFLGDGDDDGRSIETTPRQVHKRTAEGVAPLLGVVELAGGLDHAVLLDEDGHVWSFGRGWVGQVGDGDTSAENAAVQVTLPPPSGTGERVPLVADDVAAGSYHSLAVERGSGRVYGWGWNGVGQLGEGTKVGPVSDNPDTPALDGQGWAEPQCALASAGSACLAGATSVDGGWAHTVALVDGGVVAWGWNASGQLGDGSTTDRYRVGAPVLSDVVTLETGFTHVAAVTASGELLLWGGNGFGQLADGTTLNRSTPGPLNLPGAVRQIEGGSDHVIALMDDGRVYVWGANRWGELGLGDRAQRNTPALHAALSP